MPLVRKFTLDESVRLWLLADRVRAADPDLAALVERLAGGDDAVVPDIHDALNARGAFEHADRVRRLMTGER